MSLTNACIIWYDALCMGQALFGNLGMLIYGHSMTLLQLLANLNCLRSEEDKSICEIP